MKVKSESEVAQSCLTLSDHVDCSPPGSSAHGIFQARILEWGAIAFSDPGSIPGLGRSAGEGNGTHSSILAWKIPWTEKPGRLQSMGLKRVGHPGSSDGKESASTVEDLPAVWETWV